MKDVPIFHPRLTRDVFRLNLGRPDDSRTIFRPKDLLVLTFDFFNLWLKTDDGPYLERKDHGKDAYIVIHFQAQSIGERQFEIEGTDSFPGFIPVPALISGPSRLAFWVPDIRIDYRLKELLDWDKFVPSVSDNAVELVHRPFPPDRRPGVKKPNYFLNTSANQSSKPETSIEFPYHLVISPPANAKWSHVTDVEDSTHNERTELWHTRLITPNYIRAIWCTEWSAIQQQLQEDANGQLSQVEKEALEGPDLPHSSITPMRRYKIVKLSSDFRETSTKNKPYEPAPIQVRQLMLSSLGAWADLHGSWETHILKDVDLTDWKHRSTQGRDNYVRIVESGFLFPFGHKAVKISVTERRFDKALPFSPAPIDNLIRGTSQRSGPTYRQIQQSQYENPPIRAYLSYREYLAVVEPVRYYTLGTRNTKNKGRDWPIKEIKITTLFTPDLDPIKNLSPNPSGQMFWPTVATRPFKFHLLGEDIEGNHIEFSCPLLFVSSALEFQKDSRQGSTIIDNGKLNSIFTDSENQKNQVVNLDGQHIHYAPSGGHPGDTEFETEELIWKWDLPQAAQYDPPFYPVIDTAKVRIESVKQLTGKTDPITVKYFGSYLDSGFTTGGQVFLEVDPAKPSPLQFPAGDKAGGVATPNFSIKGISRVLGPVSDNANIDKNEFHPAEYFKDIADAYLLGNIKLKDLFGAALDALTDSPKFTTTKISETESQTSFTWISNPDQIANNSKGVPIFHSLQGCTLSLSADVLTRTAIGGNIDAVPSYHIKGELSNFKLQFFGLLGIKFDLFRFESWNGKKPDFHVQINAVEGVTFEGELKFVEELKNYISVDGFSDPPNLTVTPSGIIAGYSQGIPAIGIGIFGLENIKLGAELVLPFDGKPVSAKFMFSEPNDPFHISVAMFSGGGYFGISLNTDGIESIEASLEFGGNISIDLGVASGGVYIYAGIYMHMGEDKCVLEGYLRCGGAVEVLGLVCLSIEFYMVLVYEPNGNKVRGEATLTLEIDILFFSKTLELHVEREFAHSPHFDFEDTTSEEEWGKYCDSFEPEVFV